MIINDCEELSKANSSTDAIRNLYLDKMKVDGKVLVAKFALKQFFIPTLVTLSHLSRKELQIVLMKLMIIKAVEHGFVLGQHKINRRINDDLKLCIDFNIDDYPANMPDIYIKFNDTFDGNGALYCDNDASYPLYRCCFNYQCR
ncbi:hypothetical protein MXS87_22945 [Escherichia coli]|nr:hypothetical protein [Escherichia coli]